MVPSTVILECFPGFGGDDFWFPSIRVELDSPSVCVGVETVGFYYPVVVRTQEYEV